MLWPTITNDGKTIAFERDFEIWTLDTASGRAAHVAITRRGLPAGPAVDHLTLNNGFQDLELSPDGRKVAFTARGEVWAASARDGGDAVRVTRTSARESQVAWLPDSRRIVYVSERDNVPHLFALRLHHQQGNAAHQRCHGRRRAARLARRQVAGLCRATARNCG